LGIDLDLEEGDVAARGNFCTVDANGIIIDRRAGRISTERCTELCQLLDGISIEGVRLFVSPVREHRFVVVFRGEGLSGDLSDSDPQKEGFAPKAIAPLSPLANRSADIANKFTKETWLRIGDRHPANMVLLRGFASYPHFPQMSDIFKLTPAAIASYPMYRGLAKVVGMELLATGATIEEEFATLAHLYDSYDFFFLHIKETDIAGEDGDFERKVRIIEEVDRALPALIALSPDVIVVTADHSTPALLKGHSWHPVPFLLRSRWCRPDGVEEFSERACIGGVLGRFPATDVMPLALANALKLEKFGA
jgi:2,3-bisphosphoglycerate-independent phosphoglycerate mutase